LPKEIIIQQSFTFKKEEKLKSRKLIEAVFKKGASFSNFPFRILYLFQEENRAPLQAGFAVSAKNFKRAVDRNRIKRLIREAYRLQKNELVEVLKQRHQSCFLFFMYVDKTIPSFPVVKEAMNGCLKRLEKLAR